MWRPAPCYADLARPLRHRIRQPTEQPDDGNEQRERREPAEQDGLETRSGQAHHQSRLHRHDLLDDTGRTGVLDNRAKRRGECRGISGRPDRQVLHRGRGSKELAPDGKDFGLHDRAGSGVPHVRHDPDHLPRVGAR